MTTWPHIRTVFLSDEVEQSADIVGTRDPDSNWNRFRHLGVARYYWCSTNERARMRVRLLGAECVRQPQVTLGRPMQAIHTIAIRNGKPLHLELGVDIHMHAR